jgi:hypothetical protein
MKTLQKCMWVVVVTTLLASRAQPLFGVPVEVNSDSSLEGIANSNHVPFASGFYEVGWLQAGITEADVVTAFTLGNLAQIDTWFNQVVSFAWDNSANDGSTNSFGTGMVFNNTILADSDPSGNPAFATYQANVSGKTMFGWIRDIQNVAATTQMAFIQGANAFPTANDTVGFTDFAETFATDDAVITNANVWIGAIVPVIPGGAVDTNDGSAADGLGQYGENTVLQTASVGATAVPEPSTIYAGLAIASYLFVRRRRAMK